MSKGILRQCLLVGAIMCGVAVVPALAVSLYTFWFVFVPRYSAVGAFENLGFSLRLDFFRSDEEVGDSGRYVSLISGNAYHTVMIGGWDWPHRARTSVYLIDADHIAVLGPQGNDYEITIKPFGLAPIGSGSGEQWQYLGAFDFAFPPKERPRLQFFDSQLAECISMGKTDPTGWADKPRAPARRQTCPAPS